MGAELAREEARKNAKSFAGKLRPHNDRIHPPLAPNDKDPAEPPCATTRHPAPAPYPALAV
ncbi:hypothetical protein C3F00_018690 [Pseudomonas sp. MWU13-2860]|nr:hypothetical protein C3F00_018690 [Pseudomonas sp. MWU13-2860]